MTENEPSVTEFYKGVMSSYKPEVQYLVVRLLNKEFNQASDLEAAILDTAQETQRKAES